MLTKSPFNGWGLKTIKVLSPHPNLHISPFACFQNQTKIFCMRCFWLPMPSSITAFCPSSWLSRSLIRLNFNWLPKIVHTLKLFWIWTNIVCIPTKKYHIRMCALTGIDQWHLFFTKIQTSIMDHIEIFMSWTKHINPLRIKLKRCFFL